MRAGLFAIFLCLSGAVSAQDVLRVEQADGAVLRALDTITGKLVDIELVNGQMQVFERLEITVSECRYPVENPASDAFAFVTIHDIRESEDKFVGWMTAASPALSAMDHPRYDVWVLRCNIPKAEAAEGD